MRGFNGWDGSTICKCIVWSIFWGNIFVLVRLNLAGTYFSFLVTKALFISSQSLRQVHNSCHRTFTWKLSWKSWFRCLGLFAWQLQRSMKEQMSHSSVYGIRLCFGNGQPVYINGFLSFSHRDSMVNTAETQQICHHHNKTKERRNKKCFHSQENICSQIHLIIYNLIKKVISWLKVKSQRKRSSSDYHTLVDYIFLFGLEIDSTK